MLETAPQASPCCSLPGSSGPRAGVLAVCLFLAGLLPCLGADSSSRLADQRRDLEVCVHARSTLINDPQLHIEDLRVEIHDGVAVLEGEVASEEMRQRAVQVLRNVRGVREIKSDLRIVARPFPREAPVIPLPEEKPTQTRAQSSPARELPSAALQQYSTFPPPRSTPSVQQPPGADAEPPPAVPVYSAAEAPRPRRGRATAIPTARSSFPPPPLRAAQVGVHLLPPSELALPPPVKPAAPVDDVRQQVERIRRSNEHFRFLQAEVEGDTIVVQGENGAYVMELARQLTHLPGIKHVLVKVRPATQ